MEDHINLDFDDIENFLLLEMLHQRAVIEVLDAFSVNADGNEREVQRREIMRIDIHFWRRLGDPTFQAHFRMRRGIFERLILSVGNYLTDQGRIHFIRTPLDVSLMMCVWILATPDTFRSTAVKFGVSQGVVFFHYKYLIQALREMAEMYIKWPGPAERDLIKLAFEEKYGYPGIIGCIDCCHIRIVAPHIQPRYYINRHHDCSLVIQAVCDHRLLYRDIYVGETGNVGDLMTFQRSPLSHNLFLRGGLLSEGEHLVGDGAYPLSPQIMIPFVNDGHLTDRQRVHNIQASQCRGCIECSFALLRGKWRRLKYLPSYNLEYAVDHIVASIVLHNFIILEGELPGLVGDDNDMDDLPNDQRPVDIARAFQDARGPGAVKREHIAEFLHPQDD